MNLWRLTPLAAAAVLLLGAALQYGSASILAIALGAAGLITLGVWLASEVRSQERERRVDQDQS